MVGRLRLPLLSKFNAAEKCSRKLASIRQSAKSSALCVSSSWDILDRLTTDHATLRTCTAYNRHEPLGSRPDRLVEGMTRFDVA